MNKNIILLFFILLITGCNHALDNNKIENYFNDTFGKNVNEIISKLGKPIVYSKYKDAFGDNIHMLYFKGLRIAVREREDSKNYISIIIMDPTIKLPGDISVGKFYNDIIKSYGKSSNIDDDFEEVFYMLKDHSLKFSIDSNKQIYLIEWLANFGD